MIRFPGAKLSFHRIHTGVDGALGIAELLRRDIQYIKRVQAPPSLDDVVAIRLRLEFSVAVRADVRRRAITCIFKRSRP